MAESVCTQSLCDFFTKINHETTLRPSVVQDYCQSVVDMVPKFMNDVLCVDKDLESERRTFVNKFGAMGRMTHYVLKTSARGIFGCESARNIKISRFHDAYLTLIDHILHILRYVSREPETRVSEPLDKQVIKSAMIRITLTMEKNKIQPEFDLFEQIDKLLGHSPNESMVLKKQRIREIDQILSGMSNQRYPRLDTSIYNFLMARKIVSFQNHMKFDKERRDKYVKNKQIRDAREKRKRERELCQQSNKRKSIYSS
jgi:hypothetical protein